MQAAPQVSGEVGLLESGQACLLLLQDGLAQRFIAEQAAHQLGDHVEALGMQENTGAIYFDAANGRLAESQLTQDMTLNVTVGDQVIDQKI